MRVEEAAMAGLWQSWAIVMLLLIIIQAAL
jgi:hypothetical protein